VRLKSRMDLRKQVVDPIQRKAPWVVPPSSRTGEMAPPSEGTVERFWSLGETEPRPLESSERGRSWRSEQEPNRRCRETTWGVRGGNAFREGSTSADMKRGRAEGSHPGRRETSPRRNTGGFEQDYAQARGQRMHEKQIG